MMSKRKNMWKYVTEVQDWDRWLGMDRRTGDWDEHEAQRNVDADPEGATKAIANAVSGCVRGFAANPSVPALDECIGLLSEARSLGLDIAVLVQTARSRWERERYANATGERQAGKDNHER